MRKFEILIKKILNFFLEIPIVILVQFVICIILGILVYNCKETATRQYTPVVQRIHIDSTNWHGGALTITAAYDQQLDDLVKNDLAPGRQCLDFNTEAIPLKTDVVPVPPELSGLNQDSLLRHLKLSLFASGEDFKVACQTLNQWFVDASMFPGITRVSESEKGHGYLFESYSTTNHCARFLIRGNNIFTDTDPKNPYIAFHLTCKTDVRSGALTFYYNVGQNKQRTIPYTSPIRIISVFPEPDVITPTEISFVESFDQVLKHGLYFIAEDLSKTKENQVRTFFNSVLMGVFISLLVQFFIGFIKNLSQWLNARAQ